MSRDEGSDEAEQSSGASSLRDTVPGVPEMDDLGQTLPTGAALHRSAAAFDLPASIMSNNPASPRPDASTRATDSASDPASEERSSVPAGTGGPLTFGTTRREFGPIPVPGPKVTAREKAKRNILTHTLQMPLMVGSVPPSAASPSAPVQPSQASIPSRRQTIKGTVPPGMAPPSAGSKPAPPAGWTSVYRVGSDAPPEATPTRAPRLSTDPQVHHSQAAYAREDQSQRYERADHSERRARTEGGHPGEPASQRFANEPRSGAPGGEPRTGRPLSWQDAAGEKVPAWHDRSRPLDYERETLPGTRPIRIPALSAREWLFIALLACASAATLYSLLIDEIQPAAQDDYEAATAASPEHMVTPAPVQEAKLNDPDGLLKPAVPGAAPAAAPRANDHAAPAAAPAAEPLATVNASASATTQIISDPAGAEVVVGGAVIGTTPAEVGRGDKPADYLLRKTGYESQLVRVSPNSPKAITITLHAKP